MTHVPSRAHIPAAIERRLKTIPTTDMNGVSVIKDFGVFMDTHRDQPHVGTFADDIHRGAVLPTPVDYLVEDDMLRHQETGKLLQRHDKHLFIEAEEWGRFILNWMMTTGEDPRAGDGTVPTSHFRDARKKVYLLRSFRQMVMHHVNKP